MEVELCCHCTKVVEVGHQEFVVVRERSAERPRSIAHSGCRQAYMGTWAGRLLDMPTTAPMLGGTARSVRSRW